MKQGIELPIPLGKLSAPVEILNIDRRACRLPKCASLYSVAEIILAGRGKLMYAKNVGYGTVCSIWSALASYLGVCEALLTGGVLPGAVEPLDPCEWDAPISVLRLPASIVDALGSMGLFRLKELVNARPNNYGKLLGLRELDRRRIDKALRVHLAGVAQAHLQTQMGAGVFIEPRVRGDASVEPSSSIDLESILPLLDINERTWSILEGRARLLTLEETGAKIGRVSRQRVDEIIRQAHEKVRQKLSLLAEFLDALEARSSAVRERIGDQKLDRESLSLHLLSGPASLDLVVKEKELERMIILTRTLALHRRHWLAKQVEQRWGSFVSLSCLVEPPIKRREKQEKKKKKQTYKDLAYTVLARAGEPMHWSDIAREVCRLSEQTSFHPLSIHASLKDHTELFVRVRRGTYALREWGCQPVEIYSAIVASVLKQESKPMPFDWIFTKVCEIRPVIRTSLRGIMDLNPRFYRSIRSTFGLRAWLPSAGTDIPPTSDSFIEDARSFGRLERARAMGYAVDRMVRKDLVGTLHPWGSFACCVSETGTVSAAFMHLTPSRASPN